MNSNPYDFAKQKMTGDRGELLLDSWLSRFYCLWSVSAEQERDGIDRLAFHRLTGKKFSFQYKTDTKAARTGNAFVETCSVHRYGSCKVLGWAYTCRADYLFYLVCDGPLYIHSTKCIKDLASGEWQRYPSRCIPNRDWKTEGILVPLSEFGKSAKFVIGEPIRPLGE